MNGDSQIVPILLPNGAVIQAEVTPVQTMGTPRNKEQDVSDVDTGPFPPQDVANVMKALEGIAAVVSGTVEKTRAFESTVEFGLEIGLEAGNLTALLVKGTGKANLKVTLKWSSSQRTGATGNAAGAGTGVGVEGKSEVRTNSGAVAVSDSIPSE